MPELPEVETVIRGLRPRLVGARIAAATARRPDLRAPLPRDLGPRLTGRRIEGVERRAKYILIRLSGGESLVVHLGMTGRLTFAKPGADLDRHDHVTLATDRGDELRFNDARRFGLMALVPTAEEPRHPLFRGIGPEPLGLSFTGARLAAALAGKKTPIKAALLDQRVVAGIGNIYASEALFRAGISPKRSAATCTGERAARLVAAIKAVLKAAIKAGGSSLRNYVQANGELGYFQHAWKVYDRAGEPCPGCDCDGAIRKIVQAGRATYYCPRKQK
ncbi:MAG: bifunctional DNA-formamidopyrimidine glycosylase/DNA-(apurinic or apyrimidinic site) lyase [Alphaproteobacteria bacterium]|nr:bifunctional DNA-formamidopyrimidine glycosylase/DNA-(apurinic or apyrimidinic site) lyase [Alphaproteobacteria bacterium]